MKFANGVVAASAAEDCAVFKAHIEKLFQLPIFDEGVKELMDQRPVLQAMGNLPTPTEIFNASRRLRYSAGGKTDYGQSTYARLADIRLVRSTFFMILLLSTFRTGG
jgi:hypothetical protein